MRPARSIPVVGALVALGIYAGFVFEIGGQAQAAAGFIISAIGGICGALGEASGTLFGSRSAILMARP